LLGDVTGLFFMSFFKDCKETGFIQSKRKTEVKGVVRVKITLACTECKQRNYDTTKEKKNHPDRMETKKYCRFCKRHTLHKETK
jgi:large subunit ribosomal protein L33